MKPSIKARKMRPQFFVRRVKVNDPRKKWARNGRSKRDKNGILKRTGRIVDLVSPNNRTYTAVPIAVSKNALNPTVMSLASINDGVSVLLLCQYSVYVVPQAGWKNLRPT